MENTVGLCDWAWTDLVNPYGKDFEGMTPDGEPKFLNACTGWNKSFEDVIWLGKKSTTSIAQFGSFRAHT